MEVSTGALLYPRAPGRLQKTGGAGPHPAKRKGRRDATDCLCVCVLGRGGGGAACGWEALRHVQSGAC
eukprot:1152622-Pelagomonas_calceolata.AAC.4